MDADLPVGRRGAARAMQVRSDAGACAGPALGVQAVLASLLMPLLPWPF